MARSGSDDDDAKRSVASLVYDRISARITSGDFGANERLTEAELVKELGVSRGAVREAMSKLAADGLIEIELNKGAIVQAITRKDMSDFLQVRALYESFAARLAAKRIDEPGSRELVHSVIEDYGALIDNPNSDALVDVDARYHSVIMDLSGNGIMAAEWRRLRRSRYRVAYIRSLTQAEIIEAAERDRETLYAILDGDAELAASCAERNVTMTNRRIQRLPNEQFDAIFNPSGKRKSGGGRLGRGRKAAASVDS